MLRVARYELKYVVIIVSRNPQPVTKNRNEILRFGR